MLGCMAMQGPPAPDQAKPMGQAFFALHLPITQRRVRALARFSLP